MAEETRVTIVRPGQLLPDEEVARLICSVISPELTPAQAALVARIGRHLGLDPLARQIHGWLETDKKTGRKRLVVHVAIHGLRARAAATGLYVARIGPHWCGPDGRWVDVWLSDELPAAARVGILRRDAPEPIWGVATWREFGAAKWALQHPAWRARPVHMLAIRAEYHALQAAFPHLADVEAEAAGLGAEIVVGDGSSLPPSEQAALPLAGDMDEAAEPEEAAVDAEPELPPGEWRRRALALIRTALKEASVKPRELCDLLGIEADAETWQDAVLHALATRWHGDVEGLCAWIRAIPEARAAAQEALPLEEGSDG